jgi:predicted  nucleic acid-binding Zn-ribbon protein
VSELKRALKAKEEAAKDRGESIDKRIDDEVERLKLLKEDLEGQIVPLQEKHNELKQKLADERAKHESQLKEMNQVR